MDRTAAERAVDSVAIGNTPGWLVTTAGVYSVEQAGDQVRVTRPLFAGGIAADVATLPQFSRLRPV